MWNYIVLGQVPGTDYYLNFTSVLILYAFVVLGGLILKRSLAHGLINAYTSLTIWMIMHSSHTNQKQLKSYLSIYN